MKNLLILSLIFLVFNPVHSQSKIQIEKECALYRDNKVKKETITATDGSKEIFKYNKKGNPVESRMYNPDKSEANITKYFYDEFDNLMKVSYMGLESGDLTETDYYYDDESGNVIRLFVLGGDYDELRFIYDNQGNLIQEIANDVSETAGPPDFYSYINRYSNGELVSVENECTLTLESVPVTKYIYTQSNLTDVNVFDKNCSTGNLTLYSKETFLYYDNGLIKEQTYYGTYSDGERKFTYSYEFY